MGNQRKHSIWPTQFPSPLCNLCSLQEIDTCLYLFSMCMNTTLNNIPKTRHNKVVWQIHKLLLSHSSTRDTFVMNVGTHLGSPPKNIIPPWLYPCLYSTRPCHCLPTLRLDILVITTTSPEKTKYYGTQNLSLQFIEFTLCQDHNPTPTTQQKNVKYQPLINALQASRWYVTLTILTTCI